MLLDKHTLEDTTLTIVLNITLFSGSVRRMRHQQQDYTRMAAQRLSDHVLKNPLHLSGLLFVLVEC